MLVWFIKYKQTAEPAAEPDDEVKSEQGPNEDDCIEGESDMFVEDKRHTSGRLDENHDFFSGKTSWMFTMPLIKRITCKELVDLDFNKKKLY